ncbi:MAG: PKD domain-containing protein [Flavobacteriales bacterium]|nr:PKD domain-containing protein [Flavobacteriales bacterium]MCB9449307.1 PKD domain-containing protein [Flavobacteriales bacterium]
MAGQAAFDDPAIVEVLNSSGGDVMNISIPFVSATVLDPFVDTCVTKPNLCVEEGIYTKVVNNLPPRTGGYHIFYQRCCRNASINNINNPDQAGETFYTYIPNNASILTNSSPQFVNFPPIFVCRNEPIQFPHLASDKDGDSLVYSFYSPYLGCANTPQQVAGPDCPQNYPTISGTTASFNSVTWSGGYNASNPMGGGGLTIDANGFLDGIPPDAGQYVVGVKCTEYRNGVRLGYIVRDFQFNVVDCPPLAKADIGPVDPCSSQPVTLINLSDTFAQGYQWDFGDPTSTTDVSSVRNPPAYTYPGLGPYTARLIIQPGTACADTAYETINFGTVSADFTSTVDSACVGVPIQFNDNSTTSPNDSIVMWDWDFGDGGTDNIQNPYHLYADSGSYTVSLIATSGFGCQDTVTKVIYAQPYPIANGADTNACSNNADTWLNGTIMFATGGMWSGAGTFNTSTSLPTTYTPTPAEISNGSTDVFLISTGNGLCPADTDTVHITFTPSPIADAGDDTMAVCKDTSMICLSGLVGVATGGHWTTTGSGTFNPDPDSLTVCYIPDSADLALDSIMFYLTTTGNGDCNPAVDSMRVRYINIPVVEIIGSDTTCAGIEFPVSVNISTGSGLWSTLGDGVFKPNAGVNNPDYWPGPGDNANGFVTLVFTSDNNGLCKAVTDSMYITLVSGPDAYAGADTSSCSNNADVQLTGTVINTTGGFWNGSGLFSPSNTIMNPVYSPTSTEITNGFADVILIAPSTIYCPADTDSIRINFTPAPTVDAGPDSMVACKDTSGIDFFATFSVAGGVQWLTSGDGTFDPNDSAVFVKYIPGTNDLNGNSVWLYVMTTHNDGCLSVSDSVYLELLDKPVVNITSADSSCEGVCIPLAVNTTTGSGYWTTAGTGSFVPNNTVNNPFYCPSAADDGLGFVELIFHSSDNGYCRSVMDTAHIVLIQGPTADFTSNEACEKDTSFFTDLSTNGLGNITDWSWNFGDSYTSTQQNPTHTYEVQSTYNVILITTDSKGCKDTISKDIYIHPLPQGDFIVSPGCLGEPVTFIDTTLVMGGDSVVAWYWQFGDGDTSSLRDPIHVYPTNGGYPVELIVTTNVGCKDTVTSSVTVLAPPHADFQTDKTLLKGSESIQFTDLSTGGIVSWFWDFGDSTGTSSVQNPSYNYDEIGVYSVTLIVTDANGCKDTIIKTLEVFMPPAIPNAFTPNNNGVNDKFYIRGGPFKSHELRIYNNWGELIFLTTMQGKENGWDGTRDGIEQPMGVYVYIAEVVSEDGQRYELKGDLTLLR